MGVLFSFNSFCQIERTLDSLQKGLTKCKDNCEKSDLYTEIANTYWDENTSMMKYYADLALNAAFECANKVKLSVAYHNLASYYSFIYKYDSAIIFDKKALDLCRIHQDRYQLWSCLNGYAVDLSSIGESDSALKYCDSCIKVATFNNKKAQNVCYANLASIYYQMGDLKKSELAYLTGIEKAKLEKDDKGLSLLFNNYSAIKIAQGEVSDTIIEMLNFSIEHYRNVGNKIGLGKSISSLASALHTQRNFIDAIEKYRESLQYLISSGNIQGAATNLANMATTFYSLAMPDSAKIYADSAYRYSVLSDFSIGKHVSLAIIANYLIDIQNFREALKLLTEAHTSAEQMKDNYSLLYINVIYGKYYSTLNQNIKSIDFFKQSAELSKSMEEKFVMLQSYEYLYKNYSKIGITDSAYKYLLAYSILNESVSNENLSWTVNNLNTKYKIRDKNLTIANANLKNKILTRQNSIIAAALFLVIISLLVLIFLYRKIVFHFISIPI